MEEVGRFQIEEQERIKQLDALIAQDKMYEWEVM